MNQFRQWHWISAAAGLVGLMLFAATGVTLNHAAAIPARETVQERTATLPAPLLARLADFPVETTRPAPDAVARWAQDALGARIAGRPTETTPEEIYVALSVPGGDGWLTLDRETGRAVRETTTRGWVAYLNDLHKGRNTGPAWSLFIDLIAVACVVFAVSGLGLLWLHAPRRGLTWPLVALGMAVPVVIALFLIH